MFYERTPHPNYLQFYAKNCILVTSEAPLNLQILHQWDEVSDTMTHSLPSRIGKV